MFLVLFPGKYYSFFKLLKMFIIILLFRKTAFKIFTYGLQPHIIHAFLLRFFNFPVYVYFGRVKYSSAGILFKCIKTKAVPLETKILYFVLISCITVCNSKMFNDFFLKLKEQLHLLLFFFRMCVYFRGLIKFWHTVILVIIVVWLYDLWPQ